MNSEKKGAAIGKALLSGPYLIWMAGFTLIPLAMILWYGLTDKGGGLTMANVIAIASADHAKALWLSLGLSLVSTVLCLLLAYPLAMILRGRGAAAGGFIVFIFILPMWMNFLLRTLAWQTLLEKNGVINGILNWLHLPSQSMINTPSAIVLGMVYNFLPFMVLPIYNVLSKIDDNIINAAMDLGANSFQRFTRIWFPLSIPGIISGITMVFVPSLTTFVISDLLGGSKILLIGNVIEQEFTRGSNWHLGSGLSLVLMVFILISMGILMTKSSKVLRKIISDFYMVLILIFLYAPILTMMVLSFNKSKSRTQWGGFTLQWYTQMFDSRSIMSALTTTLIIAFVSALVATVIGTAAAISISSMRTVPRTIVMGVTNIPMLNADIVTGISLMLAFIAFGISLGFKTVLISHITFNIPYVILSVMPKLKQTDKYTYEAALDLGASPLYAFFKVVFPDIMPGVLSGFLLAFTMSLDDFIITHFTKGAGINTLSTLIYSEVRRGIRPSMYALSSIIFLTVLILLIFVNFRSIKKPEKA